MRRKSLKQRGVYETGPTAASGESREMKPRSRTGRRLFVLDTNVLMHDPTAIFRFEEHHHGQVNVVLFEAKDSSRIVHQYIRVEHEQSARGGSHNACAASRTSSAWPSTLSLRHWFLSTPRASSRKVLRSIPITLRPYIFFSRITSNCLQARPSASDSSANGKPICSRNLWCEARLSREMPSTVTPARSKRGADRK